MGILSRKIWRYMTNNLGQFLAASAVVMGGIIVYIAMSSAYYSLEQSRDDFYRNNQFADYYFQVVKAPAGVTRQIEELPGVRRVTGRIQRDFSIIKDNQERATARVTGYSFPPGNGLNQLTLVKGRLLSGNNDSNEAEVILDPKFLAANRLGWGDKVKILV
ncbi:MAG: ABC transporter permease, partial [Peptococcaceae bacterium]|nr:ABC transporter permease [Peptococcaceae bacterium]